MENLFIGLAVGVLLIGFLTLITLCVRMSFLITEMSTIVKTMYVSVNKIEQMSQATMQASENFVDALGEATADIEKQQGTQGFLQVFRTQDGKHVAPSMDKLIEKLKNDPNYSEMNDSDMDELRRLFEDNTDDDDEDEPKEPWKGEGK